VRIIRILFIVVMMFSFVLGVGMWVHPKPWEAFGHRVWSTGSFVVVLLGGILTFFPRKVDGRECLSHR
jgi:hypothetical protein